jgi:hypothetical protein
MKTVGRTIDEKEVGTSILLPSSGEIADDAVDVGGGRHEHVDRVEAWLWLAVVRYRFDDFMLSFRKRWQISRRTWEAHE